MRFGLLVFVVAFAVIAAGCSSGADSGELPELPEVPESSFEIAGNGTLLVDMLAVPKLAEVGGGVVVHDENLDLYITIVQPETDRFVAASGTCPGGEPAPRYDIETDEFGCSSTGDNTTTVDRQVADVGPAADTPGEPPRVHAARREGPILVVDLGLDDGEDRPSRRRIVGDTDYYRNGPQQSRPADGTLPNGTEVVLLEDAGSYSLVQTMDGTAVYVATDSLEELSAP